MNLLNIINNYLINSFIADAWKSKQHSEKYTQYAKNKFSSEKNNFSEILMRKLCTKKIMNHLLSSIDYKNNRNFYCRNFSFKSKCILCQILNNRLLIPLSTNEIIRTCFW